MKKQTKNIQAHPSPIDGRTMQLTYETAESRHVIHLPPHKEAGMEPEPHGAGSFHDPEHHQRLLDRVEAMLRHTTQ